MDIQAYWQNTLAQNGAAMRGFFHEDAYVNWHNTNEHFTAAEFIRANCEYPGAWDGCIERVETIGNLIITVVRVFSLVEKLSFHVTSFIRVENGLIAAIDEYWGDDGPAPEWRLEKQIGRPICPEDGLSKRSTP